MTKEALRLAACFDKFLKDGDSEAVGKFSKQEIKAALAVMSTKDKDKQWYKEMERHIVELDKHADRKADEVEKWRDRVRDFLFTKSANGLWMILLCLIVGGGGYSFGKAGSQFKFSLDNTRLNLSDSVIVDNRKYTNLTIMNYRVTPDNRFIVDVAAKDAVTGSTVTLAYKGGFDYLVGAKGERITDESGEPIIVNIGNSER